jgi:hypothetical protein
MKYIKKYESFGYNQSIPFTTANFLINYYSCDECDGVWKEYNKSLCDKCKYCGSEEIEELPEDEWYKIAKTRLSKEEFDKLNNDRIKEADRIINLTNLKKNKSKYVN